MLAARLRRPCRRRRGNEWTHTLGSLKTLGDLKVARLVNRGLVVANERAAAGTERRFRQVRALGPLALAWSALANTKPELLPRPAMVLRVE